MSKSTVSDAVKTDDLRTRLRARYAPPAYALFEEVADSTGLAASRSADGIAVSLYPSRGLDVHGFEIKASRADWLREYRDPEKAEAFALYCDYWWIVAASVDIVQRGELPPTWGLLTPYGTGLRVTVQAPKQQPRAMGRELVAALARRIHEQPTKLTEAQIAAAVAQEKHNWELQQSSALKTATRELDNLKRTVADFQKSSGIDLINSWSMGGDGNDIGDAVRIVLNGEHRQLEARLLRLRGVAEGIINRVDELTEKGGV